MLADITYIGDREVDAQLGCPVATHGCFYSFVVDAGAYQNLQSPNCLPLWQTWCQTATALVACMSSRGDCSPCSPTVSE